MSLEDSDALIESTPDSPKSYLGSPVVVDRILRHALHGLTEARSHGGDVVLYVQSKAAELQEIFLGRDSSYHPSFWNRESALAAALVDRCDIGGQTGDAVLRAIVRFFLVFVEDLAANEQGRLSDEQLQASVDELLNNYTHILIGSGDA